MPEARITIDPAFRVGDVDPRLFGSFVEHLGRCVYTGIYEPDHPSADKSGFRTDVGALISELGTPIVRYPGGNFVSGYRWEDGIGPRGKRPRRLELAWKSLESNEVGTDEFCGWARGIGSEPMLAVNLGTRGIDAAAALVEYCNHPGGTYWSDLRRSNGAVEPHGVRVWCLGNEMDGPWQIGHKTAEEYGRLAAESAKAMRLVDPSIELVACGSSGPGMATFGDWEATVLGHCYPYVDYVSLHSYYEERGGDRGSFLASATEMDRFIESVVSIVDTVRAKGKHAGTVNLSFDEWNVWYQSREPEREDWQQAPPLLENVYSTVDAVVVGSLLISLLRHADRVRVACLAQLVNVIAPILTEPGGRAWRQPTFHPFALTSRHGRGTVLRVAVDVPHYETQKYGPAPLVDAVAVDDDGELTIFTVNRDQRETVLLDVDLRAYPGARVVEHTYLGGDPEATNTADAPQTVVPRRLDAAPVDGGRLRTTLPPLSWNMLRLTCGLPSGD